MDHEEASAEPAEREWHCTAYGPDVPALCFFEQVSEPCPDLGTCRERMRGERQRVYRRMNELAAHGDQVMSDLVDDFASPDALLNAEHTEPGGNPT